MYPFPGFTTVSVPLCPMTASLAVSSNPAILTVRLLLCAAFISHPPIQRIANPSPLSSMRQPPTSAPSSAAIPLTCSLPSATRATS